MMCTDPLMTNAAVSDPTSCFGFQVGRDSPPELKAQKMARSGARGLDDRNLKPDTEERRRINAILMQPSSRFVTASSKVT
jgi:hypothetical protein